MALRVAVQRDCLGRLLPGLPRARSPDRRAAELPPGVTSQQELVALGASHGPGRCSGAGLRRRAPGGASGSSASNPRTLVPEEMLGALPAAPLQGCCYLKAASAGLRALGEHSSKLSTGTETISGAVPGERPVGGPRLPLTHVKGGSLSSFVTEPLLRGHGGCPRSQMSSDKKQFQWGG